MIECNLSFLVPELMDVVRLFAGAEALPLSVRSSYDGKVFSNEVTIAGTTHRFSDSGAAETPLRYKSLCKRYAKLALYHVLSEHFHTSLPWGALTGIRPTRLAYQEREAGRDFAPLFRDMGVSEENIALVRAVLAGQAGIYERREGNGDLFLSLPFCPSKCVYCSFITAPIAATRQYIPSYLDALQAELDGLPPVGNLRSIYVGGGTPFALEAGELDRVLAMLAPFAAKGCEFTVEAGRPDVFSREKLDVCKRYGVTRICINAQSFSDRTLEAIGRKHTAEQVFRAFEMAKPYGFIVNCDLIAGLTGESVEEFCRSVDCAVSLSPENVTVHTLCLKKGARLKEEVSALSGGGLSDMIAYSREALQKAGYGPYYLYRQKYMAGAHENVGWTKPGSASVYNIDIMEECADNLAVGANAVSKRIFLGEGRIERIGSPKDVPTYLNKVPQLVAEKRALWGSALHGGGGSAAEKSAGNI